MDPALISVIEKGGYVIALLVAVGTLWRSREGFIKYIMDTVSKLVADYQATVQQNTSALKTYDDNNKLLIAEIKELAKEIHQKRGGE